MIKHLIATALIVYTAAVTPSSYAQAVQPQAQSAYAVGACKSGCVFFDSRPSKIFSGTVPKSYRVCSGDGFSVEVVVDARLVPIAGNECADVNGADITLTHGKARAGRLPE